jgi:putative hydrolases of HD superfamily
MEHLQIVEFLELQTVLDKFKNIRRQSAVLGRKGNETDAEHSWHAAMWFLSLCHLFPDIDKLETTIMILFHDLPEIISGDVYVFSKKQEDITREIAAAKSIFGLFPKEVSKDYYDLWEEFLECKTRRSLIANSFDGLQPMLQNILTQGRIWKKKGITLEKLDKLKRPLMEHDPVILAVYEELLKRAAEFIS